MKWNIEMLINSYLSAFDPFIMLLLHIYVEGGYSYVTWLNTWEPWNARFISIVINIAQRNC
jgi:hypothetical protein